MTNNSFSWVAGLGIGAAAMYVPQMGEGRCALARDKMTETRKKVRNAGPAVEIQSVFLGMC